MDKFTEILQAVAAILSTLIAAIAIWISIVSERRTRKRFEIEYNTQKEIAIGSLRPVLHTKKLVYENSRGILLKNAGLGTAVITKIVFRRGNKESRFLPELMYFDEEFKWNTYWKFGTSDYYLSPGESFTLLKLTMERLNKDGFSQNQSSNIMRSFRNQLNEVSIYVEYDDILGNKQEPLKSP